ncbi:MAG: hypothetical protein Q7S73_01890 [bacterium]|nr:hypothetical protein [bacterium]
MSIDEIYQQKWRKFLRRVWPFNFIPFVDFILAAGSLATGNPRTQRAEQSSYDGNPRTQRAEQSSYDGNMNENSDFDVIVGVRQGRIFTARAFCILVFGLLGWRRKGTDHKNSASDKICFSHFMTPAAYRLSPPHNEYWKNLYKNLVPVYGEPAVIQKFFDANADWTGPVRGSEGSSHTSSLRDKQLASASNGIGRYMNDYRYKYQKKGLFKRFLEWRWFGIWANWLEKALKEIQIARIENSLKTNAGYKPRIIYNDNELEFHPDTKRIENFLQ